MAALAAPARWPAPIRPRRATPAPAPARDIDVGGGLELVTKVDAVITALEQHGELSAADLAGILDEPLSSTYRMLQSLAGIGWVDRSRSGAATGSGCR